MPKQTFFNLPENKRQRIIELAIDEFASKPYNKASLSKIVTRAGIAKGSMYQYFEDKKDLFLYLIDLAAKEKLAYVQQAVDFQSDFFTLFEQSMYAGTRFALEHPKLSLIIGSIMGPGGEEVLREVYAQTRQMSIRFYENLVIKGQEQGVIRSDIDIHLAAIMLHVMMGNGLIEYILDTLGLSMNELLAEHELANRLTEEQIGKIVSPVMLFLRGGLSAKGKTIPR